MNNEVMKQAGEQIANAMEVYESREVALPSALERLNSESETNFICTIKDDGSREAKVAIYNAINNAEFKVDDFKGKPINVVDIAAHRIQLVDEQTGEVIEATRVVLIDNEGKGFESVSTGIVSSLEKIFNIVGRPTYDPYLTVIPNERKTRKGFKTLTLDLA